MTRRIISFVLAALLSLALAPVPALAAAYTEVLPLTYDYAGDFSCGVAQVIENGVHYLIDKTGRKIHTFPDSSGAYNKYSSDYYEMNIDTEFHDGVALIETYNWDIYDRVYGLIDNTGKVLVMPKYAYISDFEDGVAVFRNLYERTYGLVDKTGKEVMPPGKYSVICDFYNGLARASIYDAASQISLEGIIDTTGKEIIPFGKYEFYGEPTGGVIVAYKRNPVTREREKGVVNISGKEIVPFDSRYNFDGALRVVAHGDTTVVIAGYYDEEQGRNVSFAIDQDGKMIVEPGRYNRISYFREGLGVVQYVWETDSDPIGVIDINGKELISPYYRYLGLTTDGNIYCGTEHDKYELLDRALNSIIGTTDCSNFLSYHDGVAIVDKFDGYGIFQKGVVDKTGKYIVPPGKYFDIAPFEYDVSIVRKIELYYGIDDVGIIDKTGKEIVPLGKYSTINPFVDGLAVVRSNSKDSGYESEDGIIDTTGRFVVPLGVYDTINQFSDGYVCVERDGKYGYITVSKPVPNLSSADSWAQDAINEAYNKGIIPADLQSNYKNIITRAEFCRMAIQWVEYKTGKTIDMVLADKGVSRNTNAFSDTTDHDILAAYALGITNGTKAPDGSTPGLFTPNGEFSREQAATMIMNTCRVAGMDTIGIPASDFIDLNTASAWAVDGINFVRSNGIMSGTSSDPAKPMFGPKMTYTRQQSIMTFNNIK